MGAFQTMSRLVTNTSNTKFRRAALEYGTSALYDISQQRD